MNNVFKEIDKSFTNINYDNYINKCDMIIKSNYKLNAFTMKLEIKNNKLIVHKKLISKLAGAFVRRGQGIIKLINNTLEKHTIKDTIFYIYVNDDFLYKKEYENLPIFILAKPLNRIGILFPDQTYIDIEPEVVTEKDNSIKMKSIDTLRKEIKIPKTKINNLFFIGQDIKLIRRNMSRFKLPFNIKVEGYMKMAQFTNYKYLLNIPGAFPWSFRFKFLFMMKSLVINIIYTEYNDSKWVNLFDCIFEPQKDYIELNYDSLDQIKLDILDIYNYFEKNPSEYKTIVANGFRKSKLLTLDNIYLTIKHILDVHISYVAATT